MRTIRRYPLSKALLAVVFALILAALVVFDVAVPLTPVEQQALIGAIVTVGVLVVWVF